MGVSSDEEDTATNTTSSAQHKNPLLRPPTFGTTSFTRLTETDSSPTESSRASTQSTFQHPPDTMAAPTFAKASIRAPQFWPHNARLWFTTLEAHFALNNIVDQTTRFHYVLTSLDESHLVEIQDIVNDPPAVDPYKKIKDEMIARFSTSQERKIKQLLEHEELGDRTPSQFLRQLQNLAGTTTPSDFVKTLWLNRLPKATQTALATQKTATLDELGKLADHIHEIAASKHVAATETSSPRDDLMKRIDDLTQQVAALTSHRSRDKSPQHSQRRSRSTSRSRLVEGICWYHNKFGQNATRCISGCTYSKNAHENR